MTITVSRLVAESLPQTPVLVLSLAVDGLVTLLVIGLIVARLLVRAAGPERHARTIRVLDVVTAPLLVVFGLFLYVRLQEILPLG